MGNKLSNSVVQQKINLVSEVVGLPVTGLEYNTSDAVVYTYDTLFNTCDTALNSKASSRTLFVGESMGGYLAAQLAAKYGAYAMLTCPVVDVYKDVYVKVMHSSSPWVYQYGTVAMTQAQAEEFAVKQRNPLSLPSSQIAVTVATNDTLLGSADATAYYTGHCAVLHVSSVIGHSSVANAAAWKECQAVMYAALVGG